MAQRTASAFKTTKNSRYADNTSGSITAANSRDMFEDTADSFLNISDHLLDEDDMASDSATKVPSQQSVKAWANGGTWTPTSSNISNVDSATVSLSNYIKVGAIVHFSGKITINATATGQAVVDLTLPISSDFTNDEELAGTVCSATGEGYGFIASNGTTDKARITVLTSSTALVVYYFTGSYEIK